MGSEGAEGGAAGSGSDQQLVFAVNGERFELSCVDPSTTLLEFLRSKTPFKSVKLGCGEGGCGACVVLLSKYNQELHQVEDITASSCLTLLYSINGCSITTSEGIGNSKDGFHAIHKRIAGFYATQCGFCTPGVCVSLYGALVNSEKKNRPDPPPGFSKLTVSEAEKSVAGNLCRCTGYRPIADACKSFSGQVDIEDLGFNAFWRKDEGKELKSSRLPAYQHDYENCSFPEFLKSERKSTSSIAGIIPSENGVWHRPADLEEVQSLLKLNISNEVRTKIVVGNTGTGYYKETQGYETYIDISNLSEVSRITRDQAGIKIGAAVSISKVVEGLKHECEVNTLPKDTVMMLRNIASHLEKIASGFIRNTASVGGNLVMAQRKNFPSDIATLLLAADAEVTIMTGTGLERLTMEEFLQRPPLDDHCVLLDIEIPTNQSSSENRSFLLFETYRAAPRPLQNALPYLNAAFLADISPSKSHEGITINKCRLAFGAYGTKHAIRARNVEEHLVGKTVSISVLYEAVKLLGDAVVPEDGTSWSSYRSSLATGYLFDFLHSYIESSKDGMNSISDGAPLLYNGSSERECEQEELLRISGRPTPLLKSSKQVIPLNPEYNPVGEPIIKFGAALQASGEAVYVDDIPSPPDCLHGAFIYSTKPLARLKGIELKHQSLSHGVTTTITSKDISGENVGSSSIFGDEPLFAEEFTNCAGDRLAFVVADTQKHADMAANSAVVNYDLENLEPPILTVEEAVNRSSFFDIPPYFMAEGVGDASKGMAEADHKILSAEIRLPSQYYFYMETQTALAVPDEDNCIVVYSSNQCPEFAHWTIAKCLGIPQNNVRVITRRVGGGFGGKFIRSNAIAAACALAAHKLRRPVRMYMNRKTDMIMCGGRHPMKITYDVGFKNSGKITALQLELLIDAGIFADASPFISAAVIGALKKYNWGALSFDVKLCKTNLSSKSAMRAPGDLQGSYIAEAIIENVASTLSMDVDLVRSVNLHSYSSLSLFFKDSFGDPSEYTLPSLWDKVAMSTGFYQRTELVKEFNRKNMWKKRGISRVPITYEVSLRPTPGKVSILNDGSIVVEVGGVEIGQGLWTKVKQMVAFGLSSVQSDGSDELLDKVRVVQTDTLSLIQGGMTAGSTTSESSCEAVRLCCSILVERLKPLKEKLEEQMDSVNWETLIQQAAGQALNLSACSFYVPDQAAARYINYGAAVSEVEIYLLTGETKILRSDIAYDCGQSLNPAVDLGQIEGAFVQGIGFFMSEEYLTNSEGLVSSDGTWTYKIPTLDTIPKEFNVEIVNTGHNEKRILSSKASGEPPLLLAVSVHCATRAAIEAARKQIHSWSGFNSLGSTFQLSVPAIMPVVKQLCGLDMVERYLEWKMKEK